MKKAPERKIARDAKTGEFIEKRQTRRSPSTTVTESTKSGKIAKTKPAGTSQSKKASGAAAKNANGSTAKTRTTVSKSKKPVSKTTKHSGNSPHVIESLTKNRDPLFPDRV